MSANASRNPVGWFEIYVQDMNRAKNFYEKTFDVKLERLESPGLEMWAFPFKPENPGCAGALVKMEGKSSGTGGTIVYFPCDDCGAMAAKAARNGARIHKDKFGIGQYGFIALVYDPDDNMIGLHSPS